MRKLQEGSTPASRNRFADVALDWALGLIEGVAAKGKGPDIFRGQSIVMGRFLSTIATFCRCARLSQAAAPLCNAVLELLLVRLLLQRPRLWIALLARCGRRLVTHCHCQRELPQTERVQASRTACNMLPWYMSRG